MSIIGESFKDWVSLQIGVRQALQAKKNRNNADLSILSNQNAWIKLGSSVKIIDEREYQKEVTKKEKYTTFFGSQAEREVTEVVTEFEKTGNGTERLKKLGINNPQDFLGTQLAEKAILFNTLSELNRPEKLGDKPNYTTRSGIINSNNSLWNNNKAYGLGGTSFGITPPPGILSLDVKAKNRGSIREANLEIKAHNKFQFELIELLYLRLGFSMLVEWGWNRYITEKSSKTDRTRPEVLTTGSTLLEQYWFNDNRKDSFREVIKRIEGYRARYKGNYDGFLGKVTNFSWKFNPDGTYDINLKLITVGDVIESLKLNLSQQTVTLQEIEQQKTAASGLTVALAETNSPIYTNAGDSDFSYNLFSDLISGDTQKWTGIGKDKEGNTYQTNYFNVETARDTLKQGRRDIIGDDPFANTSAYLDTIYLDEKEGVKNDKFYYYLTFRELLNKIEKHVIPFQNGKKMLKVDPSLDQICVLYPYQISLDPRICLVKPFFLDKFSFNTRDQWKKGVTAGGQVTGVANYTPWYRNMQEFGTKDNDCIYGNIMNIYLNYDFIGSVLEEARTNEGDVYLFKFLQKICDGINKSFGGITKIECILQDDMTITFIDQSPIPGIENSSIYGPRFKKNDVNFELFGFNPSGSESSNFVRDFGFDTKITPNIASMISIGATAEGVQTKNYDATGFSKWNKGLADRYSLEYKDPPPSPKAVTEPISQYEPFTTDQVVKIKRAYETSELDKYHGVDVIDEWASPVFGWLMERTMENTSALGYRFEGPRDVKNCPITDRNYNNYNWDEYVAEVKEYILDNEESEKVLAADPNQNYISYLANCFGGKILGQPLQEGLYFKYDVDFIKIGIASFKAFVNTINTLNFEKTGEASPALAFIPLDANLTCDGISGIRIYNQLKIRQEFLPSTYPEALKFVITKVDHSVKDNDWTTKLSTISTSNTANTILTADTIQLVEADLDIEDLGDLIQGDPEPIINPQKLGDRTYNLSPLAVKVQTSGGENGSLPNNMLISTDIVNDGRLEKLNSTAWENFKRWRAEVKKLGYNISFREGYRDIERQRKLYDELPSGQAAKPGVSPHGWGGAVDLRMFKKDGKELIMSGTSAKQALRSRVDNTWKEIATVGSRFGWYNPWRLADQKRVDEAWHFEYWGNV